MTDGDYAALAEFRAALRRFLAFSEGRARAVGLTPQQHQLLLAIKAASPNPPVVSDLAQKLLIRHHSTVELIDRLARMGLVERIADPGDRRRVRVGLTAQSEELLEALSAAHLDELRAINPALLQMLERFGCRC